MHRLSRYLEPDDLGERQANSPPPPRSDRSIRRASRMVALSPLIAVGLFLPGCKSASITEVRGKNQFGPEFRHDGIKRSDEIRYYAGQQIEAKWENGWTTAVTYRLRAIDEGSGNQEHLVLFEVGYPLWKAPKKPDKTAMQIEELQRQIGVLQSQLAGADSQGGHSTRIAKVDETESGHFTEKEKDDAQP